VGNSDYIFVSLGGIAVHPHTRGEFLIRDWPAELDAGSPPHAWGILITFAFVRSVQRFTPTRVGNSSVSASDALLFAVHPHTRGEFVVINRRVDDVFGSPPHAWGIRG